MNQIILVFCGLLLQRTFAIFLFCTSSRSLVLCFSCVFHKNLGWQPVSASFQVRNSAKWLTNARIIVLIVVSKGVFYLKYLPLLLLAEWGAHCVLPKVALQSLYPITALYLNLLCSHFHLFVRKQIPAVTDYFIPSQVCLPSKFQCTF